MTKLFLAAGVAALAITAPASAQRPDKERGHKAERTQVQRGSQRAERQPARAQRTERQQVRTARAERQPVRTQRAERQPVRTQRTERQHIQMTRMADRTDRREARAERPARVERQQVRADRTDRRQVRVERNQRPQVREARVERRDIRADRRDIREIRANRVDNRIDRQRDLRADRMAQRIDRRDDRLDRRDIRDNRFRAPARFADYSRARGLVDGCPPGLLMKNNGCLPPGQAKKQLVGTLLPTAYRQSALPLSLRSLYRDNDDYYYRYGDGYLYRVNRRDNLIASLLPLLGGGYTIGQTFPSMYMNSYVPDYYSPFYRDNSEDYYRYANGYVYEIDRGSGFIEDMYPAYGYGYGVGQMFPTGYDYYNVPMQYRDYFYDSDDYYYRYAPGGIYQVDRGTNLITSLASLMSPTGFAVGQPLPMGYDVYNVPYGYRDQYFDSPTSMYRYNNGYIYQVDPTTRLITAIISALV